MTLDIVGISEMQKCGLKYVMQNPRKRVGEFTYLRFTQLRLRASSPRPIEYIVRKSYLAKLSYEPLFFFCNQLTGNLTQFLEFSRDIDLRAARSD